MSATEQQLEPAKVVGPEESESYWQPVPANGFIRNIFSQTSVGSRGNVSIGTQTLPPGCFIREHTHAKQEEIIYGVAGRGVARIDRVEQPLETGSAVFVGHEPQAPLPQSARGADDVRVGDDAGRARPLLRRDRTATP